ncbi:Beta-ribofuranosylaminobenzene 5'-phosphate synthase [Frankliniella fusca]|uniref:Beta-ribofuranosylaminobenzene 5'-phosphate synthase n=1 Tax=Frankliniella fusca TaxID=407009 RepID=A0AAE1HWY4_9NEOP|nr:Beta-ribofuranosylaminobenzene 5'-phosphate synthase [Frankliniella fusca]
MLSVIDAINATKGFIRPMREGEELMNGGMVVSIGKKEKERDEVHIQALVLRTSGFQTKDPAVVEIWIDTSKEAGEKIVQDNEEEFRKYCDCPAGNSEKCKHMVAVMLCLTSLDEDDLDDLSCTGTEKQWGALKKSEPLGEYSMFMSCVRMGQGLVGDEEEERIGEQGKVLLKNLLTFRSWHALAVVRKMSHQKLYSLDPDLVDFYENHVQINLDQSVAICAVEQGTPEWHRARKKANWDARYRELYHSTFQGNEHTDRGLTDEVSCREKYEEKNSCKVLESGLLVRPELPWLGASLDGTALDYKGQLVRNIEIKSFKEGTRLTSDELIEMEAISTLDKNGNIKKNHAHYAQICLFLGLMSVIIVSIEKLVFDRDDNW